VQSSGAVGKQKIGGGVNTTWQGAKYIADVTDSRGCYVQGYLAQPVIAVPVPMALCHIHVYQPLRLPRPVYNLQQPSCHRAVFSSYDSSHLTLSDFTSIDLISSDLRTGSQSFHPSELWS